MRPVGVHHVALEIGPSVGISSARLGACSIDVLLQAADRALYRVKAKARRNWAVIDTARLN
jgi:GGDEF domain-containing protein